MSLFFRHFLIFLLTCSVAWPPSIAQAETPPPVPDFSAFDRYDFLAEVQKIVNGTMNSASEDLAIIKGLAAQAHRFDAQAQRSFQRLYCYYVDELAPETVAVDYATARIEDANKNRDRTALADFYLCRGYHLSNRGEHDLALRDINTGYEMASQLENQTLLADALSFRGMINSYTGELAKALIDQQAAHQKYEALGLSVWANYQLQDIANTYRRMGAYEQALRYYERCMPKIRATKDPEQYHSLRLQQAQVLQDMQRYDQAFPIIRDAYAFFKQHDTGWELANAALYMASIHLDMGHPNEALSYLDESEKSADDPAYLASMVALYRGQALVKLHKPAQALPLLARAEQAFIKEQNYRFLEWCYRAKAEAHEQLQQWDTAYQYRTKELKTVRTLSDLQNEQTSARVRAEYDIERERAENAFLRSQQELKDARLDALEISESWQFTVLVLAATLLFIFIAMVIRYFIHARKLHVLAMTDELTQLPNRRHIEEAGIEMLRLSRLSGEPCSILVFDIDFFKRINDSIGHEGGDKVLRKIARASKATLRHIDKVGRTGGEEFLVLLPSADLLQAAQVAERVRLAVEQTDMSDINPSLTVTVSIGVAQFSVLDNSLAELTTRADIALYEAKANGRNRVETQLS